MFCVHFWERLWSQTFYILRFSKDLWGSFVDVMLRTVGVVVMCYSWYFSFNLVYQETPVRIGTGCVSDLIWRGPSFIMRIIWDFFLIWGKAHDRALWGTRALQSCCNGEHEKFCDWLCFVSWSRALRRSSGTFSSSEGWVGLCKPSVQGYFGCLRNLCVLNEGTIPDSTQNSSLSVL